MSRFVLVRTLKIGSDLVSCLRPVKDLQRWEGTLVRRCRIPPQMGLKSEMQEIYMSQPIACLLASRPITRIVTAFGRTVLYKSGRRNVRTSLCKRPPKP